MGEAVKVVGIGCRKNVAAGEVLAGVEAVLAQHSIDRWAVAALATAAPKAQEPGIAAAAAELGLRLIAVEQEGLQSVSPRCLTHSAASLAATGVASVSEAAALAAAGLGSRLLGPRIAAGNVTCAVAQGRDET